MSSSMTLVGPARSAAGTSLQEARHLFAEFPQQPSAGDFLRAVEVLNEVGKSAPAIVLQSIWPVWQRHDHMALVGGCVELCARDLDWGWSPNAFAIARRFAASLDLFPELALLTDPVELGQRLLNRAVAGATLHYCALAHLVAPASLEILERLLLELTRAGKFDAVLRLLSSTQQLPDVFFSRLFDVIPSGADRAAVIDLYAQAADFLADRPTLASLRLGERMSSILQTNAGQRADPLQITHTVALVRELLRKGERVAIERTRSDSASRKQELGMALLEKTESLAARYLHNLARDDNAGKSYSKQIGEGRISWVRWQIERSVAAFIPASKFSSQYAKREGDSLYANRHLAGEVFQFGPYVDLPAGTYRVVFLGSSNSAIFELAVVSLHNTKKIQSLLVTLRADGPSSETLGTIDFYLPAPEPNVEFLIRPMTPVAELRSRGVKLQCLERSRGE